MKSLLRLTLAGAVFAALVCANPAGAQEEPPASKPPALSTGEQAAVEKFLGLKVEEVRQHVSGHNYDFALRLIDAILMVAPNTRFKRELQQLHIKANQGMLQQKVLRTYLFCSKKVHSIGDMIEVKLRIKNISPDEVSMPHNAEQARNFGVLLETTYSYELPGSSRMRRTQLTIKQDSAIVLKKNQVWEKTFKIDTSRIKSRQPVIRRYVLQAVLRPAEIVSGDERFSRYLSTGELEIWVMPSEHLNLAKDALGHLREATSFIQGKPIPGELAIDSNSKAQVAAFYSTFFLARKDRLKAVRELVRALEKAAGDTARVLMGSLSYLTKEPHGTSREDWLDWWKKQKGK